MRVAMRASTRLVNPGSAFGSNTTVGNPRRTAASIIGPAAYPPTPNAAANRCLPRIENESHIAGTSFAVLRASFIPPIPFSPAERIVSRGNPASGTRRASIPRCVPTNETSLSPSRDIHSRAIARAGNTWPPVPPPAINNFKLRCPESVKPHSQVRALLGPHPDEVRVPRHPHFSRRIRSPQPNPSDSHFAAPPPLL